MLRSPSHAIGLEWFLILKLIRMSQRPPSKVDVHHEKYLWITVFSKSISDATIRKCVFSGEPFTNHPLAYEVQCARGRGVWLLEN
jgi:hypothetical protein